MQWVTLQFVDYILLTLILMHFIFVQDFMNGVCSNIIHLSKKQLKYYGGNYDAFIRTKMELDENQAKR